MSEELFLEILFPEEVQSEDLEIITPASSTEPGRIRLKQARLGTFNPTTPNSTPLLSRSGAKIGFVVPASLAGLLFSCYRLEDTP